MTKVDLSKRPTSREQVLFGLVLFVMIFVFMRILYTPQVKVISELKGQITAMTFERDALRKFAIPSPEKVRSLSRRKGVKIKILSGELIPAYQDLTSLLTVLSQPPFLSGISVSNMSYLPSTQEAGYVKTEFALNVKGPFTDVLRYVEKMEQFPALFHLEGINLKLVDNQPQEVETEIQGRFYRLGLMEKSGSSQNPTEKGKQP